MPKIRRQNIPKKMFAHMLDRVETRNIGMEQMSQFYYWIQNDPEVPDDKWFKRFGDFTVCGEGEFVKTFLTEEQSATGKEVE